MQKTSEFSSTIFFGVQAQGNTEQILDIYTFLHKNVINVKAHFYYNIYVETFCFVFDNERQFYLHKYT